MRVTLKASLTAIMLTSVAAVPLATATTMLTADAAYAKSEKSQGKGSEKSGAAKSKSGKSASAKSKGKSTQSASTGGEGGLSGFLGKLTGKDKKAARAGSSSASGKVKVAKADPMHPSNLGNMNGALNSSPNAMLAHIRNGNYNGPVGHLAAFAVARRGVEGAQDVLDLENSYAALDAEIALTDYADLQAYLDAKAGDEPNEAVDLAAAAVDLNEDAELAEGLQEQLNLALDNAGFKDLDTYEAAVTGAELNSEIESKLAELGYDPETKTFSVQRPDEDDVAVATGALEAEETATSSILAYWNKSGVAPETEAPLLHALQDKVDANAEAIDMAVGTPEVDEELDLEEDEELVDCEDGVEACENVDGVLDELAVVE